VKYISLADPQGKEVQVPQEEVIPLLRSGFSAKRGQTVTLGDAAGTEIPIEGLVDEVRQGSQLRLQTSESRFRKEAESEYGGFGGGLKAAGYGVLQSSTLGGGGKLLIESGMATPDNLAKLQEAHPYAIGAGEIGGALALGALTGGESLVAERAGALAAKSLGRKVLESAGREAAIGGAYGAGSEITQAAIEERKARPLEGGLLGAGIGGAFGAAAPVLGAGARKLFGKGAAAEADAAAKTLAEPAEAIDAAAIRAEAKTAYEAKKTALHAEAQTLADEASKATTSFNDELDQLGKLGFKSSRPIDAIHKTDASIKKISQDLLSDSANLDSLNGIDELQKITFEATEGLKAGKIDALKHQGLYQGQLTAAEEELKLATATGASKEKIAGIEARKLQAQESLTDMGLLVGHYEARGTALSKVVGLQQERLETLTLKGAEAGRYRRISDKLAHLGEETGDLAGSLAAEARTVASETRGVTQQVESGILAAKGEVEAMGIKSTARYAEDFIPVLKTVGRGDPAEFRAYVQDMLRVERGLNVNKGNISILTETFKHKPVADLLSAENAAYVHALAEASPTLGLARAIGTRADRLPNRVPDNLASVRAGLDEQTLAGIKQQALADFRSLPEPLAGDAQEILQKYRLAAAERAGKQAPVAAAAPAVPAAVKTTNIVAANPGETAKLRTALDLSEKTLGSLDKALADNSVKRSVAAVEFAAANKSLAEASTVAKKRALTAKVTELGDKATRLETNATELGSLRENVFAAQNAARTTRTADAIIAAEGAETLQLARDAIAQQKTNDKIANLAHDVVVGEQSLSAQKQLKIELTALNERFTQAADAMDAFTSRGLTVAEKSGVQNRLVPYSQSRLFEDGLKAFEKSVEGKELLKAMKFIAPKSAEKMFTKDNVLGALSTGFIGAGPFGGGMGSMVVGVALAALGGKKAMYQAASSVISPVKFWSATSRTMDVLARGAVPTGRALSGHKGYTFSVPAANAYLDGILKEREAMGASFDKMLESGAVDPAHIQEARTRFDATVDYLERKRPTTSNGADAQNFARAVAVIRDPDLLAKFVHEGSLRQQDVDVMKSVSPEAYEQLKGAVQLLQEKRPEMATNLAPLFKLITKTKSSMRGGSMSLALAQSLVGASSQQQQPMAPGAEAAAARARPPAESPSVEGSKLIGE
jgi:hypothetical protein